MPHGRNDSGGEFGLEAGVSHCLVEGANARGDRSAEFTVDELLHGSDLDDASLFVEVGGDHADAAEDGAFAEAADESVDMAHAVEDGIDHGVGADCGGHIVHCLLEGEGFYAEENNVEGAIEFFGGDGFGLEGEVSVRTDDAQAFAAELLYAGGSDEKGDIASGLCETRSKVAADGAGTNDKNLHRILDARALALGAGAVGVLAAACASLVKGWWMLELALAEPRNRCRGAPEEGDR